MNVLEQFIKDHGLDASKTLDMLQEKGLVSDNAVYAKDVYKGDCELAVAYLQRRVDFRGSGS